MIVFNEPQRFELSYLEDGFRADGLETQAFGVSPTEAISNLAVLEKGWDDYTKPLEYGDVEEVCFWTIITDKGTVDIETRLSHNGYYGGYVDWYEPTEDHEVTN